MAEKKIGARIVIDGEAEFRAKLASSKTALNAFQSELKLVTAKYKDNRDSLEALGAKQQVYIKLQEEQKNKLALLQDMQEKVVRKYNAEKDALTDLGKAQESLNAEIENAKTVYGANSEEVEKLSEKLKGVNEQYEAQEKVVQKTGDRVNRYQRDCNNAELELTELNAAIAENERCMQEAETSADECGDVVEDFGNEAQEAGDKTSVFADVLKAELLASVIKDGIKAIANGITTIATAATQTGMTFEASMSQVAATMGLTTDEIARGSAEYEVLSKAAQDCGKATMFSASQSAEALNYLALAGYDAEKAASTLPRVLNLAAAGNLELQYAADLVTDSMAALGLETSELDNYIDEMAKTSQKSNTSVAQLGEATLVCAGTVALTGQSLETMNTALGVMANNGLKGAEGGTHLRNVLLSLSAPTDKASDAIKSLGLRVYDSKGNMRDLNDIITDMNRLMSDMTRDKKTNLIKTIFNKTDIAAVNALLKSTNGEYKNLNAQISDCSGAAQAMADTLNDNLKGRVTILKSAMEGLGITAYNLFDDEMKSAVDSATDAVSRLQGEIDNGDLGVSLRDMSKALGEVAENAIGTAEKALPKMIDGFTWLLENGEIVAGLIGGVTSAKIAYTVATETATIAQKLFNVTANANPYIFLATAIAGVVGAITLYSKTADKETAQLTESTKKLTDASKKMNEEIAAGAQKRAETKAGFDIQRDACIRLVDELDALQSKTNLTASEQARQVAIIDELNTAMPELNLSIDEQTGLTNMSTEALLGNIDAQMELMKVAAAREDLTEIADQQWEAEKKLAELRMEQEEATKRLADAEARMNEELECFKGISRESQEAWRMEAESCNALTQQIGETMSHLADLGVEYEQTMSYISKTEAITTGVEALKMLGSAALGTSSDISQMSDEIIEKYNEMYDGLQKNIWGQMDLFSKFTSEVKISSEEILANMQSQIDGVSQWAENMDILADRGINQGLLQHLANLGPQGAGYVEAFVKMTNDQLKEANKMFEESVMLSDSAAMNITDSYFEAGRSAAQGFEDGVTEEMDAAVTAARNIGESALQALKTELDINSPSKKTREMGESFDEGLQKGIDGNGKNVLAVIRQLTGTMLTETKTGIPPEEYKRIGTQTIEGLRNGIEAGKSRVLESIRSLCERTIQAAKEKLDIHSPSKAFEYLGEMSGEGYTLGLVNSMEDLDSIIAENMPDMVLLGDEIRSEYEKMVEDAKSFCGQILDTGKSVDSLGSEYTETMADIANDSSVEKAGGNVAALGEAVRKVSSDIGMMSKETVTAYHEMYTSVSEKVSSQMDLFSEFSGKSKMSAEELLKNMQSQVTGVSQWAMDMDTLADRGINQGLLQRLADMGPTGAGYVSTFVGMTSEELDRANKLFETALALPDATAALITDSFVTAGADAAKGLADGILSGTGVVEDASASMSYDALETVRTTLDEHSPSKKTEEMGRNFDEGLRKGIDGNKQGIFNLIRQVTSDMILDTRMGLPDGEFFNMGRNVAEGLQRGIESGKSGVIATIQSMCRSTIETARAALDIHSPSREFAWLGKMSGEGYITGWEDTMANINNVIQDSLPDIQAIDPPNTVNAGMAGAASTQIYEMCERMYNMMAQYMPGMSRMQVVTDTGALVGELLPVLDNRMGEMQYDKDRGLYE